MAGNMAVNGTARTCQWCGKPILREDCPYTTDHGFRRMKYHPGECADEAKREKTRLSHRSGREFRRAEHRCMRERIRLLKTENERLRTELVNRGWT